MPRNIILATTESFTNIASKTDLGQKIKESGFETRFLKIIRPPFDFNPDDVVAIAAGDNPVGEKELSHFPNLKVVARFGKGIDNIDCRALNAKGILVANARTVNHESVAELTIGFMLALARDIILNDRKIKNGAWDRNYGKDLRGMELGIIGLGNVGKEVARLASAFGMKISANDIVYDEAFLEQHLIARKDFNDLLETSDIITLHVPLTDKTKNFINHEAFSKTRDGVYLINTSRGAVVDEDALLEALENGKAAGAALDVFREEPPFTNELIMKLINHPKVIAAPHVGAVTLKTHYNVGLRVFQNIKAVLDGNPDEADIVK